MKEKLLLEKVCVGRTAGRGYGVSVGIMSEAQLLLGMREKVTTTHRKIPNLLNQDAEEKPASHVSKRALYR